MRLQHERRHAVATQHVSEGFHGRAIERSCAQHQRMRAGLPCLLQNARDGILRRVAVEQGGAKRAIRIGADERGQRDLVGAPHRNDRHETDQSGSIAPHAERRGPGAAACGCVYRQFPIREIIAVRLDGAPGERAPWQGGYVGERRQPAVRICGRRRRPRGILVRCATDYRCFSNIDHFPVSPSRFIS